MAGKQHVAASVWRLAAMDRKHFSCSVQLLDYRGTKWGCGFSSARGLTFSDCSCNNPGERLPCLSGTASFPGSQLHSFCSPLCATSQVNSPLSHAPVALFAYTHNVPLTGPGLQKTYWRTGTSFCHQLLHILVAGTHFQLFTQDLPLVSFSLVVKVFSVKTQKHFTKLCQ